MNPCEDRHVDNKNMDPAAAASGAAAAGLLRQEAARLLAVSSSGIGLIGDKKNRLGAALSSVQAAAAALDNEAEAETQQCPPLAMMTANDAACWAWRAHAPPARPPLTPRAEDVDDHDVSELFSHATECIPQQLRAKVQLSVRPVAATAAGDDASTERLLELHADGAFTAVVAALAAEPELRVGSSSAIVWLPTRVAIGPSGDAMAAGASQPPTLLVFQDLCARAGAILVGLDALPASRRLQPLLRWLASLHNLFEASCCSSNAVFPPAAASAAELLPPTARCERLLPHHAAEYYARHGRSAEEAYLAACSAEAVGAEK